ncbi:MAG: hypothetical protein A2Y12_05540 [Planctomycetes bacterium GWF2_42_9]|nr:MAG: hypothetical protein A2Y12_05540 [Planctomycetes bacterium GWF2_42_9]
MKQSHGGQSPRKGMDQNDPSLGGSTAAKIAKEHGVGEATVKRAVRLAKAIESLKPIAPELGQKIQNREPIGSQKNIIQAAEAYNRGDLEIAKNIMDKGTAQIKREASVIFS